jgi:hypothetical protein
VSQKKAEEEGSEQTVRNYHQQFCLDQQDQEANVGLPVLVFDCTGLKAVLCNRNRRNCNFLPCETGTGTVETATFCLAEPEPEP